MGLHSEALLSYKHLRLPATWIPQSKYASHRCMLHSSIFKIIECQGVGSCCCASLLQIHAAAGAQVLAQSTDQSRNFRVQASFDWEAPEGLSGAAAPGCGQLACTGRNSSHL